MFSNYLEDSYYNQEQFIEIKFLLSPSTQPNHFIFKMQTLFVAFESKIEKANVHAPKLAIMPVLQQLDIDQVH